jgi:two-component system nitrate/nitrite response regulator NarL
LAVTEILRKEMPNIKVLMLSTRTNTEFVLRCVRAGANGYVLKQASPDEFVQAIETVNAGVSFFSPSLARTALSEMVRSNGQGPDPSDLTAREREVLTQIAEGLCNKEIACRLNIGTRTVETHRERLMRKLDIHSVAGLTRFAVAKGMISVPEMVVA